jgi:hypothetical protein
MQVIMGETIFIHLGLVYGLRDMKLIHASVEFADIGEVHIHTRMMGPL